jgi:plasmid replication initiation protein
VAEKPKILKIKVKKVYKSNKLNKAWFSNFNLNDYRVYLNAIALVGGVDAKGKYLQPDELKREHTLSAIDFAKQFNIPQNHAYEILKKAVDKLIKTDIKVEKPDLFTTTRINVCELAEYHHRDGSIRILFTGSILEHLKQQIGKNSQFTLYNLNEIIGLSSLYAVRLYELIQQFKGGFIIYTIEQWREVFGISIEQYKLYGHFKDKVLKQALNEINNKTGYSVTMLEEKKGRKVARVRFDYNPVVIHNGVDPKTGEFRSRHIKPKNPKTQPKIDVGSGQLELEI